VYIKSSIIATGLLVSLFSFAQTPASIDVGGFDLYPSLNATLGHDDNLLRSDDSEVESWMSVLSPELILVNSYGLNEFQIGYRLERGDYYSSQADDYTDHLFNASANLEFDVRNRLEVLAIYMDDHDERGTNFTIGRGDSIETPDQFKQSRVEATYSYGAPSATGRLDLMAGYSSVDYDINTDLYRTRDRKTNTLAGTFFYNIMPATDLTLDVIYNDIDYDFAIDPTAPLDSEEVRTLVGVEWDTTAKTSGYVKIGHRQKEFDDGDRADFSGLDWLIGVTWNPRTYSTLDFTTFTTTNETNGEGDFIDRQTYQLTWDHKWQDRVSTSFEAIYSEDEYTGANSTRVDDNTTISFFVNYTARRYLMFNAGYTFDQRNSNQNVIDFNRNVVSVGLTVTL
jgi:hypothetical protein|tara:strand:+ start:2170 stop:3357 length:1188 start_codon:yes stop_codon:yes gene_type:complete